MKRERIEKVEVFGVAMPLVGTFTSGGISKSAIKCVVVRLTTSGGAVGISSMEPSTSAKSPHTAADLVATVRERLARELVGQDPLNVNRIVTLLDKLAPTQPGAGAVVVISRVSVTFP